jgi:hypothetical protein
MSGSALELSFLSWRHRLLRLNSRLGSSAPTFIGVPILRQSSTTADSF